MSKNKPACRVYVFSLDLDDDDSPAAQEEVVLSKAELSRASRFIFPIHRQRFIRGRTWMRVMLSDFCDIPAKRIDLHEREFGKPVLKNSTIRFNLSHAENNAVLAVSDACEVGIDVESDRRELDVDALRATLYTDLENKWLDALPASQKKAGFFKLWTAKEARMKVTGEGFSLAPKDIEVQCANNDVAKYTKPLKPKAWLTHLSDVGTGLHCALATSLPVTELLRQR